MLLTLCVRESVCCIQYCHTSIIILLAELVPKRETKLYISEMLFFHTESRASSTVIVHPGFGVDSVPAAPPALPNNSPSIASDTQPMLVAPLSNSVDARLAVLPGGGSSNGAHRRPSAAATLASSLYDADRTLTPREEASASFDLGDDDAFVQVRFNCYLYRALARSSSTILCGTIRSSSPPSMQCA